MTLGCAMFVLTGDISSPTLANAAADDDSVAISQVAFTTFGLVLLSVFIVFDGLTSTVQDKLFQSFEMHSVNQLLHVSCWSALLSGAYLMFTGQLRPALAFVARHPDSLQLMLLQSIVSVTIQLFISFTIKEVRFETTLPLVLSAYPTPRRRARSFLRSRSLCVLVRGPDVCAGDGHPAVHVYPLFVLDFQAFAVGWTVDGMLAGRVGTVSAGNCWE